MKKWLILSVIVVAGFIPFLAKADMGPKPGMLFLLENKTGKNIFPPNSFEYFECNKKNCSDAKAIDGYVHVEGSVDGCGIRIADNKYYCTGYYAYWGLAPYHKIRITFNDGVRESGVFPLVEGANKNSLKQYITQEIVFDLIPRAIAITIPSYSLADYEQDTHYYYVEVTPFGLNVHYNGSVSVPFYSFLIAIAITVIVELVIAFLFLKIAGIQKKLRFLLTYALLNIVTLYLLWHVFPLLLNGFWLNLIIGELAVIFIEYLVLALIFNKTIKPVGIAITIIIANIASWAIGFFLL